MACIYEENSACPFAFTEESELVQNYGCIPTPHDIIVMRVVHGKTWACHKYPEQVCKGAIKRLRELGLPSRVEDKDLVTELDNWGDFCDNSSYEQFKKVAKDEGQD